MLIKDPYFLVRVYEKYNNVRSIIEEMVKDGGTLDQYEQYLSKAGAANDSKWLYTYTLPNNASTNWMGYGGENDLHLDSPVEPAT